MPLTIFPEDFLKTGNPRRTWPQGQAPTWLNRHGTPQASQPPDERHQRHEAWTDWMRHVEAGRIGG